MLIIATAQTAISFGSVVIGLLVVLAGGAAGLSIFLSRRTTAIRQMQTDTITALQGSVTSLQNDKAEMASEVQALQVKTVAQENQIKILTEQVLQAAKVDALTHRVDAGFEQVNTTLLKIIPGGRTG